MAESPNPPRAKATARERPRRIEAFMGFLVLAAILVGEIALIRGSYRIEAVPLPPAAQMTLRLTFGR